MNIIGTAKLKLDLKYTTNLFGGYEGLSGKTLQVISRNDRGDCICIVCNEDGVARYLVDVDSRDIETFNRYQWFDMLERFMMMKAGIDRGEKS